MLFALATSTDLKNLLPFGEMLLVVDFVEFKREFNSGVEWGMIMIEEPEFCGRMDGSSKWILSSYRMTQISTQQISIICFHSECWLQQIVNYTTQSSLLAFIAMPVVGWLVGKKCVINTFERSFDFNFTWWASTQQNIHMMMIV